MMAASVIAQIPTDPGTVEAIAKWPLTVVLGAVCCVCVWLMYRQARDFAKSAADTAGAAAKIAADSAAAAAKIATETSAIAAKTITETSMTTAKAIADLVAELKQRPCIRNPNND